MPFEATVYRVLIASPGDVLQERDVVERAIINWDDEHARDRGVVFLPVRWERTSPRGGISGQEAINEDLVDTSDVLIGVFWSRIGEKTASDDSGSIEEIRRFARSGKPYGLFFNNAPIPMHHDPEQFKSLRAFKSEVHSFDSELRGLTQDFASDDELLRFVGRFLTDTLRRLQASEQSDRDSRPRGPAASVRTRLSPNAEELLKATASGAVETDSTIVTILKSQHPTLARMSHVAFQSAREELERRGVFTVTSDRGDAGLFVTVLEEGLDRGLRAITPDYSRAEGRIQTAICNGAPTTVEDLAERLSLPKMLVRQVADTYAAQDLLKVETFADVTRIRKPASQLCGWDVIRDRKACLVLSSSFRVKGGDRNTITAHILNEGEAAARDVKAMWDLGDGFPPEPGDILFRVIPPELTHPGGTFRTQISVPQPLRDEANEAKPGQEQRVRLKLTFRDGLDERDEAIFTIILRNDRGGAAMWNASEDRQAARIAPICQAARPEAR